MTLVNDATDTLPDRQPSVRAVAMPSDTNPTGDIFGGWLMSQMDLAAGTAAARRAKGRTATVFVDSMSFLRPVHVGDEVSFFTEIIHVGRTSLRIHVQAWRQTALKKHPIRSPKVSLPLSRSMRPAAPARLIPIRKTPCPRPDQVSGSNIRAKQRTLQIRHKQFSDRDEAVDVSTFMPVRCIQPETDQ